MSNAIVFLHDTIDPDTGNTYKQDNMKLTHKIPVGALVEVVGLGGGAL